jgi:hypothetical protein
MLKSWEQREDGTKTKKKKKMMTMKWRKEWMEVLQIIWHPRGKSIENDRGSLWQRSNG